MCMTSSSFCMTIKWQETKPPTIAPSDICKDHENERMKRISVAYYDVERARTERPNEFAFATAETVVDRISSCHVVVEAIT